MTKKTQPSRRPVPPAKKKSRPSPVMAAELLLEIGVEELPYQFIAPALATLKEAAEQLFKDHRLAFQSVRTLGTPRRLTLVVEGLATLQTSMAKEAMGPSKSVAFDPAGQPTRAAMGFAAGQGVAVHELQVRQTPKGEYLFAVKQELGRPTKVVLGELLPLLIAKLSFPKAMKWNTTGVRFARPVRWLVVVYGGATLPIEAAGITAGNKTEGHRVLGSSKGLVVRDSGSYLKRLERQGVTPDPQRRRHMIEEQIATLCKKAGFSLNVDEDLLEQAVYTTECPNAIIGEFKEAYLDVPEEILITSMKEHQGFFSLRHKDFGTLAARFIAVTNNRAKDMGLIREGNERVLAARLADAKFFFDEDRKVKLEDRVKKLAGITFHQKLGTMAQKQERLRGIASFLASLVFSGHEDFRGRCVRAAELCKADLLTGIVGEFPELQGIIGGEYAKHDDEESEVALAIRSHYQPRSIEADLPETDEGKLVSLTDKLDTVVAFLYVGIVPTGSEDPFGLRRSALGIVRIIVEADWKLDLRDLINKVESMLKDQGFFYAGKAEVKDVLTSSAKSMAVVANPRDFILDRLQYYGKTVCGLREDVIQAVLGSTVQPTIDLADLILKMKTLQSITVQPEFDPLIVGFKRAHRLVEKEKDRVVFQPVNPALFQHPSETKLREAWAKNDQLVRFLIAERKYSEALEAFVSMKPAIDDFFTAVMVNADDPAIRINRLSLLKDIDELFLLFADFSQIVVQGA
ncbi:MAG: glycine--tRNA ligase subunit beta [Nitrospiraceae bacterium]